MNNRRNLPLWWSGAALGILAALLIWPQTRWMVREQVALTAGFNPGTPSLSVAGTRLPAYDSDTIERLMGESANRHPNDLPIQLALACYRRSTEKTSEGIVKRIRALSVKFPDRPSVYANGLRFASQWQVRISRTEERVVAGNRATSRDFPLQPPPASDIIAAFEHDAEMGERLEPDNGYFPMARAIGLFAVRRDAEAVAALKRASEKHRWEEYYADELEGLSRMNEDIYQNGGAIYHVALAASILFPHYAGMRSAARVAVYIASQAEKSGRKDEGLALRKVVLRCGSLMRDESKSLIGSLVGIAITRLAIHRPGGEMTLTTEQDKDSVEHLTAFEAYLRKTGRSGEFDLFKAEIETGNRVRAIAQRSSLSPFGGTPMYVLFAYWTADMIVLANILWLLALGGLAALLCRTPRMKDEKPMPTVDRIVISIGIIIGFAPVMVMCGWPGFPGTVSVMASCALIALIPSVGLLLTIGRGATVIRGITLAATTISLTMATVSLGVLHSTEIVSAFASVGAIIMSGATAPANTYYLPLLYVGCLLTPLLCLVSVSIASAVKRVPISVGVAKGMRAITLPVTAILIIIYAVTVNITIRQEAVIEDGLQQTLKHEGRFLASLAGTPWPGKPK